MRCTIAFALSLIVALAASSAETDPSSRLDPDIKRIIAEISPARIEANIRKLVSFQTRHTLSDTTSDETGIGAARRWIKSEMENYGRESGGRLIVEFDTFQQPPTMPRVPKGAEIVNVVATLPTSRPESRDERFAGGKSAGRIYVVSGHYDSMSRNVMISDSHAPGANDDASGTAAVMELARVMSRHEFDATLVFMAVAGEEQGLLGAKHWADEAKKRGANIAAMFTNDIVGNTRADDGTIDRTRVRLFAEGVPPQNPLPDDVLAQVRTGGENDFPTRQLARAIKEIGGRYMPRFTVDVVYRRDRFLRGGDHSPFLDHGFAAVRFTEPHENYAHQHEDVRAENGVRYGDLPEFVDFDYVANVSRLNAAALASLARAPAPPTNVQVEVTRLDNDTVLRWAANTEPDLAGYRIVWRETTAPAWQQSAWADNVTRFTIAKKSKDNFIFGVQAVDNEGHASPAVYPTPWRGP